MFNVRKMEIYLLSVCSFVLFVVLGGFRYTYFFLYSTWVECRFFQFGMDLVIHLSLFVINIVVHLSLNINHLICSLKSIMHLFFFPVLMF